MDQMLRVAKLSLKDGAVLVVDDQEVNRILIQTERALTLDAGLPGRPWFRHQIYAPGFYTGYGVKTLPAVREAIEQREWDKTATHIDTVAATLERYADTIGRATALLRSEHAQP